MPLWSDKSILITGVTGTLGTALTRHLLHHEAPPRRLVGFSRRWQEQEKLRREIGDESKLRLFVGDVRDYDRLLSAMRGVEYIIHTAALKDIRVAAYNPNEAISINIHGTENVLRAAMESGVKKVVVVSSDKACAATTLYGATKNCTEHLAIAYNSLAGGGGTRFSAMRYGNYIASTGSFIPLFFEQKATGKITVTHPKMTRFFNTPDEAARFALTALENMIGGEIFIPSLFSARIMDFATAIAPEAQIEMIGLRPGEKLHEVMVVPEEARRTYDIGWAYQIVPEFPFWSGMKFPISGSPVGDGWTYSSASATRLSQSELQRMVTDVQHYQATG